MTQSSVHSADTNLGYNSFGVNNDQVETQPNKSDVRIRYGKLTPQLTRIKAMIWSSRKASKPPYHNINLGFLAHCKNCF